MHVSFFNVLLYSAVCFFIYVSFRAVVSVFLAFLSSRHSSALYCFYCIVSALTKYSFIRPRLGQDETWKFGTDRRQHTHTCRQRAKTETQQQFLRLHTDRATRRVSRNLANCCTAVELSTTSCQILSTTAQPALSGARNQKVRKKRTSCYSNGSDRQHRHRCTITNVCNVVQLQVVQ